LISKGLKTCNNVYPRSKVHGAKHNHMFFKNIAKSLEMEKKLAIDEKRR
jgi:hypothetical protein